MSSANFSLPGKGDVNEDSVLCGIKANESYLFAIADGMGGGPSGEVASRTAILEIERQFSNNPNISLENLFGDVKDSFIKASLDNEYYKNMGTTLTVCRIYQDYVEVGHVGDSRVYHLRGNGIVSRTIDQTELQALLDEGVLTKSRANRYHRRHVLLSVMSPTKDYVLQLNKFSIENGDRLILMTDGVYEIVAKREIRDISLSNKDPEKVCDTLKKLVEERGVKDDYSAICIDIP